MENFLNAFGHFLKEANDSGTFIIDKYSNEEGYPKNPSTDQETIINFLKSLSAKQKEQLKISVSYCIESTLFKLIDILESGSMEYSFELKIKKNNQITDLISENIDNELKYKLFEWLNNQKD